MGAACHQSNCVGIRMLLAEGADPSIPDRVRLASPQARNRLLCTSYEPAAPPAPHDRTMTLHAVWPTPWLEAEAAAVGEACCRSPRLDPLGPTEASDCVVGDVRRVDTERGAVLECRRAWQRVAVRVCVGCGRARSSASPNWEARACDVEDAVPPCVAVLPCNPSRIQQPRPVTAATRTGCSCAAAQPEHSSTQSCRQSHPWRCSSLERAVQIESHQRPGGAPLGGHGLPSPQSQMARAAAARAAVSAPRPITWAGWVSACSEGRDTRIRSAIAAGMDVTKRDPKVRRARGLTRLQVGRQYGAGASGSRWPSRLPASSQADGRETSCPAEPQLRLTGLHHAAKHGRVSTMTILIEHGADVNARSKVSHRGCRAPAGNRTASPALRPPPPLPRCGA